MLVETGRGKYLPPEYPSRLTLLYSNRIAENEGTTHNSTLNTMLGVSSDTEEQASSHSCPGSSLHPLADLELPSLEKVRQPIAVWQSEWGAESTWPKRFHEELKHAQGSGWCATDAFFSQCAEHVKEGRQLVWILRSITRKGFRGMRYKVSDLYEQVFDLLTSLLTELRFFEVKLDEYAPVFPLSRISEACYYFTV